MKRLLALLWLLLPMGAWAQLYHPGEELHYRVSYRARLFPNTEVATVVIKTDHEAIDERQHYRVRGHGKTLPTYRLFFPLDDLYTIHVDTATLRTRRFASDIHEGDYTFRSHYDYDWEQLKVSTWSQSRQRTPHEFTLALTERSMDPISLFFNMRTADSELFDTGEELRLEMVLEDTVRHLRLRYLGREVKKIRSMGKFRTLKFACQLGTSEGYSITDGDEFYIWISDDRNRIPLWLESPIRIGSIQAYIVDLKGLKYPLESKIK